MDAKQIKQKSMTKTERKGKGEEDGKKEEKEKKKRAICSNGTTNCHNISRGSRWGEQLTWREARIIVYLSTGVIDYDSSRIKYFSYERNG